MIVYHSDIFSEINNKIDLAVIIVAAVEVAVVILVLDRVVVSVIVVAILTFNTDNILPQKVSVSGT